MLVVRKFSTPQHDGRLLRIRDGRFTIVDKEDYDYLSKYKWYALKSAASEYIVTRKIKNGRAKVIRMHRLVTNCPPSLKVHHLNNNTFDNRKENLKNVTEREHRHFDGWRIFHR